ncbi:MAG: Rib/alpha-like domain-containing protein, partial [Gemella sp.]|nr:Rib/alpha-like domain-containing protein [Gemella sp.]
TYPDGTTDEVEVPVRVIPVDATKNTPVVTPVEKVQGTPLTAEDITGSVAGYPAGSTLTVTGTIPTTETPGDKGTVTVEITYPDGSKETVEVPVNVTPLPVSTEKGTGIINPEKPELELPVTEVPKDFPTVELPELELPVTEVPKDFPTVELPTLEIPAEPTTKPADKPVAKPEAPVKKVAKAGVLPKTSATTESNAALPAGLAAALAAAGLLVSRRRKED